MADSAAENQPRSQPADAPREANADRVRALNARALRTSGAANGRFAFLEAWRPGAVRGVAFLSVFAAAAIQAAVDGAGFLSILYIAPVALVAWRLGPRSGLIWAGAAAVAFLVVRVRTGTAAEPGSFAATAYLDALAVLGFLAVAAAAIGRLRRVREEEWRLAGTDHLTGVLNGRAFHDLVELERSRTLRYNRPFTLAYMDVDGFKAVNDRLGHRAGDEALRVIAETIRENIRSMDTVARLGGDEFGLLLPETGPGAAEVALRKIQLRLAEVTLEYGSGLSFSMGAIVCVGAPESVDALIQRADALMYDVKQAGRNGLRTVVLDESFGIEAILQRS